MAVTLPIKAKVVHAAGATLIGCSIVLAFPVVTVRAASADLTELSLEELMNLEVSGASRFPQKITEAPASVTIITAMDIKTYGYRTLADILQSVRGLFVTNDRNYQYVGVRGFNRPGDYNSRILLLVDGNRLNDAIWDTASIGQEFFLDVDLIDRVEVVRGPGSSVYGSNAFFGVVNVITRGAGEVGGLEVSGEAASFGTGKGRLTYGHQTASCGALLLSATYLESQGQDHYFAEFDSAATNNGVAQDADYERAKRLFGKLALGGVTFTGAYSERIKGVPTASYDAVFNDSSTQTSDSQTALDLGYSRELAENLDLSGHLYYGDYTYVADFPYDQPPVIVNKEITSAEWWGAEVKLVAQGERHKLVTGLEFQDNFRQDMENYDLGSESVYLDSRNSSERRGLYVQDEMTIMAGLLLNAGLRYDHYSTVGDALNPRLALIYNPREATTLKVMYGTAFRAPNVYELYYNIPSQGSKPSENLKPEEITTYEFVVEHQLRPRLRLTASVYKNEISNLINQVTDLADDLDVFRNIDQVEAKGVELEAEQVWAGGARLRASYAWQTSRDEDSGEELTNSPRHLAKLNFSQPWFGEALRSGLEVQYTGRRQTLSGGTTGEYTVANLTLLTQKIAPGLELAGSVYNIFDRRYGDPGRPEHVQDVLQQDGINFRCKLSYRY